MRRFIGRLRELNHRGSFPTYISYGKEIYCIQFPSYVYVAVNFLFQLIFGFPLFLGMVMHANEFETKEKQKLTEIKNKLQHIHRVMVLETNSLLNLLSSFFCSVSPFHVMWSPGKHH